MLPIVVTSKTAAATLAAQVAENIDLIMSFPGDGLFLVTDSEA
jgi:hypothetical protein